MGETNHFEHGAERDDLADRLPIDDLIDPSVSDDDLLLAARLDRPQDHVPPRSSAPPRSGWPPPPVAERPNRLERDPNGMLGGVASGIAYRLGVDPALVRVPLVLMACTMFFPIPLYLILWGLLPEAAPNSDLALNRRGRRRQRGRFFGVTLAFIGCIWLLSMIPSWGAYLVPLGFVGLGVWLFWRDRDATVEDEMPLPFTDSMDPLGTSPEYQRYIANKAKRLEQRKRRRNTTIAITAVMATVLAIGAAASQAGEEPVSDARVNADTEISRLADIPDQDVAVITDSEVDVVVTSTSNLRDSYDATDSRLRIDLSDADFDAERTVSINVDWSDVEVIVPPGGNLNINSELVDSSLSSSVEQRPEEGAKALTLEFSGTDSQVTVVSE